MTYFKADGISKRYGKTIALDDVTFKFESGQIVGLIGENGAGKSTLLKIISGIEQADRGHVFINDKIVAPKNYAHSASLGITMVFQEQSLIPNIKVFENLLLSHEHLFEKFKILNKGRMIEKAKEILESVDLGYIDPTKTTDSYNFSTRQMIEIARAIAVPSVLGIKHPLILFDEPTASLNHDEVEILFEKMRLLKDRSTIIFVSHRLEEIRKICDTIVVFKDGKVVDTISPDTTESDIHKLMVGRIRNNEFYKEDEQIDDLNKKSAFSAKNLSKNKMFENVSFDVSEGEILGIGGVLGCGKSELGKVLAGYYKKDAGEIFRYGQQINYSSISKAIKKGIGYIPAERHKDGIILPMSIKWNLTLAAVKDICYRSTKILNYRLEKNIAQKYCSDLNIKMKNIESQASDLSGGNQQKVVIGKWLFACPKVLILDNPTRGVDVGAKEEVYSIIRELIKKEKMPIILITDDLLELIGLSNKILIMKDKKINQLVEAPRWNKPKEDQIVRFMV